MLPARKAEALLFSLAVEGRMLPRAQLLWPDLEAGRGRSNLRRTLVMLRQALDDQGEEGTAGHLLITPDALGLRQERKWLHLDLYELVSAWQEHQRGRSSASRANLLRDGGQHEQAQAVDAQANALLNDLATRFTDDALRDAFLASPSVHRARSHIWSEENSNES